MSSLKETKLVTWIQLYVPKCRCGRYLDAIHRCKQNKGNCVNTLGQRHQRQVYTITWIAQNLPGFQSFRNEHYGKPCLSQWLHIFTCSTEGTLGQVCGGIVPLSSNQQRANWKEFIWFPTHRKPQTLIKGAGMRKVCRKPLYWAHHAQMTFSVIWCK